MNTFTWTPPFLHCAQGLAAPNATTPATLRAYLMAEYWVLADPPFTLRVGEPSLALARLHAAHRASGSAFITACNPRSAPLGDMENSRRQARLAAELDAAGYAVLPGMGTDPAGDWPGEPSFLVLSIDREAACGLSHRFDQNALLWSGPDAIPQLMLLR